MARTLFKVVGIWVALLMLLSMFPAAALAGPPDPPEVRDPAFCPPAPWLEDKWLLEWAEKLSLAGITKDSTPEEVRAAIKEYLKDRPMRIGEPGGPNPRAYKRLLENEAKALAAGKSPKAMGLSLTGTAKVLIIPVEFTATQTFIEYTDAPTCSITTTVTITGPLHNQMPDPAIAGNDNSTFWMPDFDQPVYDHLFFDTGPTGGITTPVRTDLNGGAGVDLTGLTAANYYLEQSGGVYTLDGYVTPWMQLPVSEGEFGADGTACQPGGTDGRNGPVWRIVISATNALNVYWQTTYGTAFPWSDYDMDHDGIVDHLMIIHAGADQADGGGAQGDYAIWSQSWDVDPPYGYVVDPVNNIKVYPFTIVPENTNIGVYVHEFGHDIGLPDFYDVTYASGNSTGFWELMSSGSWNGFLGGVQPAPLGLWCRYVLGWADPVFLNTTSPQANLTLGQTSGPPAGTEDGVIVNLPIRSVSLAKPYSGSNMWWGNNDKNYADSGLVQTFAMTATTPISFTLWADYLIEADWDYFFVEVSTDGGTTWVQLPGYDATTGVTVTTSADPNGRLHDMCGWRSGPAGCQLYNGLTGGSGGWTQIRYDLTPYAGQNIELRLTYATDAGYLDWGIFLDDLSIDTPAGNFFFDDVEAGMDGWTKDDKTFDGSSPGDGWIITNGTLFYPHYYLAEWRNYDGFDEAMKYCYNHVYYATWPNLVERVPYDLPGMLLWYRDYRYSGNTPYTFRYDSPSWGDKGMCLIVDAHPQPYRWDPHSATAPFSNLSYRMQTKDAAFSMNPTQSFTLTNYRDMLVDAFSSRPAVNQFHDSQGYYPGLEFYAGWGNYWQALGSSVVVPAKADYYARWLHPAWYDLGNPGPLNYGVHIVVEDQAADGSWGKVHIWNDNDTFLGKKEVSDLDPEPGDTITYTIILKDSAGSDSYSTARYYYGSLTDFVPAGSTIVPASISVSGPNTIFFDFDALTNQFTWYGVLGDQELSNPDAVIQFAVVTGDGNACNTASFKVEPDIFTYHPKYDDYELRTVPCSKDGVMGLKTVDKMKAQRGEILLYTVTLSNTSDLPVNVSLNDHTPAWTVYVAGSVTGGANFVRDNPHDGPAVGNIVWSGQIPGGGSKVFTFQAQILDSAPFGTYITNQAEFTTWQGVFDVSAATQVELYKIHLPLALKDGSP